MGRTRRCSGGEQPPTGKPPAPHVVSKKDLGPLHRAVEGVAAAFIRSANQAYERQAEYELEAANQSEAAKGPPKLRFGLADWVTFLSTGQVLCPSRKTSVLKASLVGFIRGLQLLSELATRLSHEGFAVKMMDDQARLQAKKDGEEIRIRLTERKPKPVEPSPIWSGILANMPTPTGKFSIHFESGSGHSSVVSDEQEMDLEDNWPRVVSAALQEHEHAKSWAITRDGSNRQLEEERRVRAAAEHRAEAARLDRVEEDKRREALIVEAGAWQAADAIRAYLRHLDQCSGAKPPSREYEDWRKWAGAVADEMDPAKGRKP